MSLDSAEDNVKAGAGIGQDREDVAEAVFLLLESRGYIRITERGGYEDDEIMERGHQVLLDVLGEW